LVSLYKKIFAVIFFLILLGSLTSYVHATQTFTIPPGNKQIVNVNLNKGDFVNGTVSVSGGSGAGVDFTVSDPNGKELLGYNYVSNTNFSFSASTAGRYILIFDNSFCSCTTGKNVTLDYAVNDSTQLSSEGLSIGFQIAVIIVLAFVILTIAAVVIIKTRLRTKPNNGRNEVENK
jgi:emp24/gp25L/p24 family/GOLD